jgi:hypothetical protein
LGLYNSINIFILPLVCVMNDHLVICLKVFGPFWCFNCMWTYCERYCALTYICIQFIKHPNWIWQVIAHAPPIPRIWRCMKCCTKLQDLVRCKSICDTIRLNTSSWGGVGAGLQNYIQNIAWAWPRNWMKLSINEAWILDTKPCPLKIFSFFFLQKCPLWKFRIFKF